MMIFSLAFCDTPVWAESLLRTGPVLDEASSIPASLGLVHKTHRASDGRYFVYHIQDLHGNVQAQTNIAQLFSHLLKQDRRIGLAGLEGSAGVVDVAELQSVPEHRTRVLLGRYYLERGWIGGIEYGVAVGDLEVPLNGMEAPSLYLESVAALRTLVKIYQDAAIELDRHLESFIHEECPRFLKRYFDMWVSCRDGNLSLDDLAAFLKLPSIRSLVRLSQYPSVDAFLSIKARGGGVDPGQINRLQNEWVETLIGRMSRPAMQDLLRLVLLTRSGKLSELDFLTELTQRAQAYGLDASGIRKMRKYLALLGQSSKISHTDLFKEVSGLLEEIGRRMRPDERAMVSVMKHAFVLRQLLLAKASREDSGRFDPVLTAKVLFSVITDRALRLKVLSGLASAARFYDLSRQRDRRLLDNLVSQMERLGVRRAVLVTGGYHTHGLQELMEQRGISFVTLSPRVADINDSNYWDAIGAKVSSFEEAVLNGRQRLALPSVFGALADRDTQVLFRLKRSLLSKVLSLPEFKDFLKGRADGTLPVVNAARARSHVERFTGQWLAAYRERLTARRVAADEIERRTGTLRRDLEMIEVEYDKIHAEDRTLIVPFRLSGHDEVYSIRFGFQEPFNLSRYETLMETGTWDGLTAEIHAGTAAARKETLGGLLARFRSDTLGRLKKGLKIVPAPLPGFGRIFRFVRRAYSPGMLQHLRRNPSAILAMVQWLEPEKQDLMFEFFGSEGVAGFLVEPGEFMNGLARCRDVSTAQLRSRLASWKGSLKDFLERGIFERAPSGVRFPGAKPGSRPDTRYNAVRWLASLVISVGILLASSDVRAQPSPDGGVDIFSIPPGTVVQSPADTERQIRELRERIAGVEATIRSLEDRQTRLSAEADGTGPAQTSFRTGTGEISASLLAAPPYLPSLIRPPGDLFNLRMGAIWGDNPQLGLVESPFFSTGLIFRADEATLYPRWLRLQYTWLQLRGGISAFDLTDDRQLSVISAAAQLSRTFTLSDRPRSGSFNIDFIGAGDAAIAYDHPDRDWRFLNFQAATGAQFRWTSPDERFRLRTAYNLTADLFPTGLISPSEVDFADLNLIPGHSVLTEFSTSALRSSRIPEIGLGFEERFMSRSRRDRIFAFAGINVGMSAPLWLNLDMYRDVPDEPGRMDILTIPLLRDSVRASVMLPVGDVWGLGTGHVFWQTGYTRFVDVPFDQFQTIFGINLTLGSGTRYPSRVDAVMEPLNRSALRTDSVDSLLRSGGFLEAALDNLDYDRLSVVLTDILNERLSGLDPLIVLIIMNTPIEDIPGNIPPDIVDEQTRILIELILNRILASGIVPGDTTVQQLLRAGNLRRVLPIFTEDVLTLVQPVVQEQGMRLLGDRPLARDLLSASFALLSQSTHYLDLRRSILGEINVREFFSQITSNEATLNTLTEIAEGLVLDLSRQFIAQLVIDLEEDARRILRISSATEGLSALELNERELRDIAHGSRARVRRHALQRSIREIERELRESRRELQRLNTDLQRLELEQFRRSMGSPGYISTSLMFAISTLWIPFIGWQTPGHWLTWAFTGVVMAGIALFSGMGGLFGRGDSGRRDDRPDVDRIRAALEDLVKSAAMAEDGPDGDFRSGVLHGIFGEPDQFLRSREAMGQLDSRLYKRIVLNFVRDNPLEAVRWLARRGFVDWLSHGGWEREGLPSVAGGALRTIRRAAAVLEPAAVSKFEFLARPETRRVVDLREFKNIFESSV